MRLLCIAFLMVLALPGVAEQHDAPEEKIIRIGVRVDTRPFAWQDPTTGDFRGFLADLCTAAVTRAGFPFRLVPVDATERLRFLKERDHAYDVLCDPTTISLGRLQSFARGPFPDRLRFSPIVFVANGVWVRNADAKITPLAAPPDDTDCVPKLTNPEPGPEGNTAARDYLTAGFVVGTTAEALLNRLLRENALPVTDRQSICPVAQASHVEGITAFCKGTLAFYFGDLDIVRETASDLVNRGIVESCGFDHAPTPISYEPYALIVTDRTDGFRPLFVAALYAVFADRISTSSTAEHFFDRYFEDLERSPFLDALFRINRLPPG
ncbi:Bacterial extracellular solute-binding proteins, family 3 [Rhodobacteraceae bacterium THAF1]|uniref:substrate-binding periplasmic protein n=1 Tax=Palleronia sp. THAF1 TaxID=2587842 RepID=UPI000F3B0DF6|nr:transporter substrate-binding domain-containing protein [Palleronia sp. THAF1]QFU10376.1 Bacterial extracellular solute-binding protein, family 3 [Palleronia sp. THAF1]VDC31405.1 Bacterial extracellular solute-binding proteins, family 3 [Rhodobacteraceae bacterium THAF1]